jgi:outer membrane protein assembly factor BamB
MPDSSPEFSRRIHGRVLRSQLIWLAVFLCGQSASSHAQSPEDHWGQWRGPQGTGVSETAKPPIKWSESENIRWKTSIPGLGHSTPVVWNKSIFLTTAIPIGPKFAPRADNRPGSHDNLKVDSKYQFVVLAIDRPTGKIRWQTVVNEAIPREAGHYTASLASASPVTDGDCVIAHFGSHGLFCLDLEGNVIWEKKLGTMHSKHGHGEGASPALFENSVVINWDHEGQSFLASFDKTNGNQIWKVERDEVTSWASPVVCQHNDQPQVIVAGTGAVRGYDLETGQVVWQCGGLSANIVATPIAHDGMVYVGSSYEKRAMFAIRLEGAIGDITDTENVVWQRVERTPYVPSPLLYLGSLYFLRHYQGILSVVKARSGEESTGPFRINGLRNIYASPVAADGKLFITDRDGTTVVISQPDLPRLLSVNQLDDCFSASMALSRDELFLRGEKSLYCIAESKVADR